MPRLKFPSDVGGNLFEEALTLRRDGSVELDGKRIGGATGATMEQIWKYQSGRQDIILRFELYVQAERGT